MTRNEQNPRMKRQKRHIAHGCMRYAERPALLVCGSVTTWVSKQSIDVTGYIAEVMDGEVGMIWQEPVKFEEPVYQVQWTRDNKEWVYFVQQRRTPIPGTNESVHERSFIKRMSFPDGTVEIVKEEPFQIRHLVLAQDMVCYSMFGKLCLLHNGSTRIYHDTTYFQAALTSSDKSVVYAWTEVALLEFRNGHFFKLNPQTGVQP